MPVITPIKRRSQLPGRLHVRIGIERMRNLIRILLVNTIERELSEAISLFSIKTSLCCQRQGRQKYYSR